MLVGKIWKIEIMYNYVTKIKTNTCFHLPLKNINIYIHEYININQDQIALY